MNACSDALAHRIGTAARLVPPPAPISLFEVGGR